MARYHINPETGNIGPCSARIKCAFDLPDSEHLPNKAAALQAAERKMKENHEIISTVSKTDDVGTVGKYSFVREFKRQEEQFEKDFDGIPTRFFNTDLRKKFFVEYFNGIDGEATLDNLEEHNLGKKMYVDPRKLITSMMQATSSPDDNNIPPEEIVEAGERLGLSLRPITDERYLKALGVKSAWIHSEEYEPKIFGAKPGAYKLESAYIISSDKKIGQSMGRYSMRYVPDPELNLPRSFRVLETRSLVGADRVLRKTGENLMKPLSRSHQSSWVGSIEEDGRRQIVRALFKLEESQLEGKSFKAQQKYIKESSGKIATVWDEKKDTDEIRKAMSKKSRLRGKGKFRSIDLDNDVDPEAFERFEEDYEKISQYLPKFPEGKEPALHVRKLGKHSSSNFHVHGLFNPAKNSIAVDIREGGSSSTVHEVFHQWDIITKGNLSLSPEFQELSKEYSKRLVLPSGVPSSRAEYYSIPTEQLARMAEVVIHDKVGDDTMLLDSKKFENFDYRPIVSDPEFKKRVIEFFDKHMK